MLGKSHWRFGVGVSLTIVLALHKSEQALPVALSSFVGSLAPDLDEPGSMGSNAPRLLGMPLLRFVRGRPGRRGMDPLRALLALPIALVILILTPCVKILSHIVKFVSGGHRGATHSVVFLAALALLAMIAGLIWPYVAPLMAGFVVGYALHLAADASTISGLPGILGHPSPLHLLPVGRRFRTGSTNEKRVVWLFVIAVGVLWATLLAPEAHAAGQAAGHEILHGRWQGPVGAWLGVAFIWIKGQILHLFSGYRGG